MIKKMPEMQETWVRSLGWEDPLKESMATHSNILAWRIPMDRSLAGYSPWGHKVRHEWAAKHSTCLFVDTWAKSVSPRHIYLCKFKAVNDLKIFTQLPSFYSWANWATEIKRLSPNLLPCSWQSPGLCHKLFSCLPAASLKNFWMQSCIS